MNNRKNTKIKDLAYSVIMNILCEEELRKTLVKQTNIDIMAKLISILERNSSESQPNSNKEITQALKALSNALQENLLFLSFLQQKGHVALNQIFEIDNLEIKEACLAIYTKLAMDKECNIMIVLESDLIYDVLSLDINQHSNIGAIRNMLILLEIMLVNKNENAIEQLKGFDIVTLLIFILSESQELGYLALTCLGLLLARDYFRKLIT